MSFENVRNCQQFDFNCHDADSESPVSRETSDMQVDRLDSIRLPNQSLRIMCEVLIEFGLDPIPLITAAGIDPNVLDDPWSTLNGHQELRFEKFFLQTTGHVAGAAFHAGLRYSLVTYGPLGLAVLVSANVTEGLRLFTKMQALGYSMLEYRLVERDGIGIAFTANDQFTPADMREFMHERALGSVPTFFWDLRQQRLPLKYVESPLDRPKNWMNLDSRWETEFIYRSSRTAFHFEAGAGALPLPMTNPVLAASYRRLCENMLETSPNFDGIVNGVYQVLMQSRTEFPSAVEVAGRLHVSERTLHRRLAQCGSSYGAILDNVRLRRARELLEDSSLAIAAIGERLGYAETASFSRFFRRVAGVSPATYRKTSRGIFASALPMQT
ncbi:helix-turn-helix domain-containing protein [Pseudochelatococcus lubricantis]|uniref:AraC family transcriptional regulator n=1 Tax=Pseudochelatococcus lubricantis TaxID=1538102 RepID=UPI0035ECC49F